MIQLCRASDKAAKAQVQHIVLALTPDGEIHINGSGNMIDGMLAQPAILGQVKGIMIASQQAIGEVQPVVFTGLSSPSLQPILSKVERITDDQGSSHQDGGQSWPRQEWAQPSTWCWGCSLWMANGYHPVD